MGNCGNAIAKARAFIERLPAGQGEFSREDRRKVISWITEQIDFELTNGCGSDAEQLAYFAALCKMAKERGSKSLAQYLLTEWSRRTSNLAGQAYGNGYKTGYRLGSYFTSKRTPVKVETAIKRAISGRARRAANVNHTKGKKAQAKLQVRECFDEWQRRPDRYASAAAFARDMLDKHPPDTLGSQAVIERWVRNWRREA